eukprot:comp23937_c0_seq1/m.42287 comp23937_c0_seq1/g.42287  ORF comp23937_c0_seq1/g.42287 comp23937_c0_seq1/m.42287 type:complete len:103 (+) comp23937_c0_seq1:276-584(+)
MLPHISNPHIHTLSTSIIWCPAASWQANQVIRLARDSGQRWPGPSHPPALSLGRQRCVGFSAKRHVGEQAMQELDETALGETCQWQHTEKKLPKAVCVCVCA